MLSTNNNQSQWPLVNAYISTVPQIRIHLVLILHPLYISSDTNMVSFCTLIRFFLTAASAVSGYANPGACSGHCWAHDPSVIQRASDGLYFKFNTGSGIEIATSSSLTGPWTLQGYVLPSGSSIDLSGNTDLWVRISFLPDLIHISQVVSNIGSRCSSCRQRILSLLRSFYLWFPE